MLVATCSDLVGAQPHRALDSCIERSGIVECNDPAHKGKSQIRYIGVGRLEKVTAHVATEPGDRFDMMRGFLERFPDGSLFEAFAWVQVTGRLVESKTLSGLLLHHQKQAVAFDDGGHCHIGLPVIHAGFYRSKLGLADIGGFTRQS